MIQNVYIASPFFNEREIKNIEYAEKVLESKGIGYFSPMRHQASGTPGTPEWAEKLFKLDVDAINKADAVVLMYYGNYSDSGTAWECGYAYSVGKPVVVVHVDRESDSNLMIHCGCATNVYLDEFEGFDFGKMPVYRYEGKMY